VEAYVLILDGYYLPIRCRCQSMSQSCARLEHPFLQLRSTLINADIGPSTNLNWVATIWTIGSAIGFLLVGRLSDIFGRKWMVMGTSLLGLLGCIVGGTAKNIDTLVGANLMNGIGAAGQLSFGIVLGELVPNKHRGPIVTLVFASSLPFAGKFRSIGLRCAKAY
jgi:MFS family permease